MESHAGIVRLKAGQWGTAVAVVFGLVVLPVTAHAATARGQVFEDKNGNAVLDAGETGIADVRVSDGERIVLTDAQGRYELKIADEAVIRITKPRGYGTSKRAKHPESTNPSAFRIPIWIKLRSSVCL